MDKMHSDNLAERLHPKESKKNMFCREQKNFFLSFCNIKYFKKLLTSVQKVDL